MNNKPTNPIVMFSDRQTWESLPGATIRFIDPMAWEDLVEDRVDAGDAPTTRDDITIDLNDCIQMATLRHAGFFQGDEDALSLVATIDSLDLEKEALAERVEKLRGAINDDERLIHLAETMGWSLETDNTGQIVMYTGKMFDESMNIVPLLIEDEGDGK
jgi:hypothetical protein